MNKCDYGKIIERLYECSCISEIIWDGVHDSQNCLKEIRNVVYDNQHLEHCVKDIEHGLYSSLSSDPQQRKRSISDYIISTTHGSPTQKKNKLHRSSSSELEDEDYYYPGKSSSVVVEQPSVIAPPVQPLPNMISISEFMTLAASFESKITNFADDSYKFYNNGKMTLDTIPCLPCITLAPIVLFSTPEMPRKTFIRVTKEDGTILHGHLRRIYGIPDSLKYSFSQTQLGYTLEEINKRGHLLENAGIPSDMIHITQKELAEMISAHNKRSCLS